ncbi:hypothetical protein QNO07_07210 [Streptomyces sp. 549]|uniref:hypothetical protein n=1 Tax=Streptomyces sp. 549 TaxID=3049076 RepID=UPI0024C2A6EA|nr:hypothetical protein [Streptomyces sp. 549]MDK1473212.1 hypothetical protein [Streptomyces sp. 549]
MSFMDEWAEAKARAQAQARENATHTNLAGLDGPGPGPAPSGPSGTLAMDGTAQSKAGGYITDHLLGETEKASRHANPSSGAAQRALDGFELAGALKSVTEQWNGKARMLNTALLRDRGGLLDTRGLHIRNESDTEKSFKGVPHRPSPLLPNAPYPPRSPLSDLG